MTMNTGFVNIEVFVIAYNRESLIKATLESLLKQTRAPIRICVVDNGSTDNTAEVVKSYSNQGVELVRRRSNDPRKCFLEVQSMARGPWTMVFHDDDLLHPQYLHDVSHAIAKTPNASIAVSSMVISSIPEAIGWARTNGNKYRVVNRLELARLLYAGFRMPFCSAVYRTDVFKTLDNKFSIYGKISDRPFILDALLSGTAVVMTGKYVNYRIHSGQDSTDYTTGPFLSEVFALQKFYREILGEQMYSSYGRIFLRKNYSNLSREYYRRKESGADLGTFEAFMKFAVESGATAKKAIRIGCLYSRVSSGLRTINKIMNIFLPFPK